MFTKLLSLFGFHRDWFVWDDHGDHRWVRYGKDHYIDIYLEWPIRIHRRRTRIR